MNTRRVTGSDSMGVRDFQVVAFQVQNWIPGTFSAGTGKPLIPLKEGFSKKLLFRD